MRKWNFCAGPAAISEEVLKEVQSEILEFSESGMSVMEMSHRSDIYSEVAFNAKKDFINLLKIPNDYDVLFLQGGATHQFSMIAYNYKHLSGTADYVTTGSWSKKAFNEASKIFELEFPHKLNIVQPIFFIFGNICTISGVDPEFEIKSTISFLVIDPMSPCIASLGCIKKDGVPVLEKVAASLLPMCPDFPTPIIINFPFESKIFLQNKYSFLSKFFFRLFIAEISNSIVFFAIFRASFS